MGTQQDTVWCSAVKKKGYSYSIRNLYNLNNCDFIWEGNSAPKNVILKEDRHEVKPKPLGAESARPAWPI
jgi:hypothetical protein